MLVKKIETKVTAATLIAAIVTILTWLADIIFGIEVPTAVTGAITTVAVAVAGWLAPHTERQPDR